ncbi:MAG TPA: HNH endonuclease, partial [Kofleriaceae bacterium]|nr:HNH endonuclease [Kofleriaceae bacterium]
MTDDDLLAALDRVLARSRCAEAELVGHLGEVDRRRLYLGQGCSSMFGYCTQVLHMSEGAAYMRIAAARAARRHPALLDMLADGRLHVSGIARLAPHLTEVNRDQVLARAVHRSKRQIEELVAELSPRPDAPTQVRKLPAPRRPVEYPKASSFESAPAPAAPTPAVAPAPLVAAAPPLVEPLAPARYKIQFTASANLKTKLDRLTAEMLHQVPGGDLATLIEIAVTEKRAASEKRRYARAQRPRENPVAADPASRHIPAAVRRAVRERDGDRCTFVGENGRRCTERGGLEFHHDDPFGKGGAHSIGNVRLVCRAHNVHLAERDYGTAHMQQFRSHVEEPRARYTSSTGRPLQHQAEADQTHLVGGLIAEADVDGLGQALLFQHAADEWISNGVVVAALELDGV